MIAGMYGGMIGRLLEWFGRRAGALVSVLMVWGVVLTVIYFTCRILALRTVQYRYVPLLMFPVVIAGDLFTEMVFLEFDLSHGIHAGLVGHARCDRCRPRCTCFHHDDIENYDHE